MKIGEWDITPHDQTSLMRHFVALFWQGVSRIGTSEASEWQCFSLLVKTSNRSPHYRIPHVRKSYVLNHNLPSLRHSNALCNWIYSYVIVIYDGNLTGNGSKQRKTRALTKIKMGVGGLIINFMRMMKFSVTRMRWHSSKLLVWCKRSCKYQTRSLLPPFN